jgi:hypothetical protein
MRCGTDYEALSRYAAGDLDASQAERMAEHVRRCPVCQRRLRVLRDLDQHLAMLPREEAPASALLRVHRAVAAEVRGGGGPELMTLDEVAAFLRISLDELEEIVLDLPAFEVAGQLRVRRARLIEWVEARERAYGRTRAESEVARVFSPSLQGS